VGMPSVSTQAVLTTLIWMWGKVVVAAPVDQRSGQHARACVPLWLLQHLFVISTSACSVLCSLLWLPARLVAQHQPHLL
jgi:hypothetical protein